jgi:hypothetical protein
MRAKQHVRLLAGVTMVGRISWRHGSDLEEKAPPDVPAGLSVPFRGGRSARDDTARCSEEKRTKLKERAARAAWLRRNLAARNPVGLGFRFGGKDAKSERVSETRGRMPDTDEGHEDSRAPRDAPPDG